MSSRPKTVKVLTLADLSTPLLAQELANHVDDPGRAPLDGLRVVAELRRRLDAAEEALVVTARARKYPNSYYLSEARHDWRQIAEALGVSKTAAHRKHSTAAQTAHGRYS